jgi:hypothetical protein
MLLIIALALIDSELAGLALFLGVIWLLFGYC